jgi:hypothetical protein
MRYSQRMSFEERLALIRRGPDECWLWQWAKTPRGYGHFRRNKLDEYAHRAAYELLVGPIPERAQLDHSCVNPPCCNPRHLTPLRAKRHVQRHNSVRKVCFRGHSLLPVTPDTWHVSPSGKRMCMQCYRGWLAVRWDPKAAEAYKRTGKAKRAPRKSRAALR